MNDRNRRRTFVDTLFDHPVRADQYGMWDREAERLGSLEVYYQFVLAWQLDRKVGGRRAAQDAVHVHGSHAPYFWKVRTVGHESASVHE